MMGLGNTPKAVRQAKLQFIIYHGIVSFSWKSPPLGPSSSKVAKRSDVL